MSSIFISHSSEDEGLARQLARRLEEQNHTSVFLDVDPAKGLVAGQSWERTLYRKLRACRAICVVCTDNYLRSQWCFAELALARMEGKHVFVLKADPLDPVARLPSLLKDTQMVDLRSEPEEGFRRIWRALREEDILGAPGDWSPAESPYLGLSAFQERHAAVFFGREDETRGGVEMLTRGFPPLVLVLGASGSGKSSLVRAGILPRLRRQTDRWIIVEPFRPGSNPLAELAASMEQTHLRYAPPASRAMARRSGALGA